MQIEIIKNIYTLRDFNFNFSNNGYVLNCTIFDDSYCLPNIIYKSRKTSSNFAILTNRELYLFRGCVLTLHSEISEIQEFINLNIAISNFYFPEWVKK